MLSHRTSTTSGTEDEPGTCTVTAEGLYIREDASISAKPVGSYVKGDKVVILETRDGWGRTDKGWISLDYVKFPE